ncbi:MAG: acyl carrier protein [bacterium ADurb.Bin243]|nr:MAG: acyl carrier protein [bacterium ADurb.Bin243]
MSVSDELNKIFREVFDDVSITVNDSTTADGIEGWDSLSHINLIVVIEKRFGIKFSAKELLTFKNVGDLKVAIEQKIMR